MLNNKIDPRAFKTEAYTAFAAVTRALSSPRRLELLDLLIQGPLTVEALARAVEQPTANTSQHLQTLKRSRLVMTERSGTHIAYRLAPGVADVFVALRRLATAHSPDLQRATEAFYQSAGAPETIDRDALMTRLADGKVTLIDVRPAREYASGHIPGALSMPLDALSERLSEGGGLPGDGLVVVTCRGPYCVFAARAVRLLRGVGRAAVRFEDGVAEWRSDGGALATGTDPVAAP